MQPHPSSRPAFTDVGAAADVAAGRSSKPWLQSPPQRQPAAAPDVQATESQDAGVQRGRRASSTAATDARWPMYLRNVKQILRAADGGFDERRYGFGGLMDLLKACQRDGLVRIERDRRGGLRVFQGPSLAGTTSAARPTYANLPQPDVEDEIIEADADRDAAGRAGRRETDRRARRRGERRDQRANSDRYDGGTARPREARASHASAPARPAAAALGTPEERGEEAGGAQGTRARKASSGS